MEPGSVESVKAKVIQGDARRPDAVGLSPGAVDCIVTSPPYWNLKRYNEKVSGEIGHGQTLNAYLGDMRAVFESSLALIKDTGVMWIVVDTIRFPARTEREYQLMPLPIMLAELAQEVGWRFQDLIVWQKNKTLPYSGAGKLRNLIEYILLLTKSREFKHRPYRLAERHLPAAEWLVGWPERYHPLGKHPANIWKVKIPTQGIWAQSERLHFCPLPAELVRRCLDLTTDAGDVVLDPFAGIGTVPAQAEAMGRVGLGIELNPSYIDVFETTTREQFLAQWEQGARRRQLAREDQASEAALILRLRALKAGRELSRHLEKVAQARPSNHPATKVQSVIVRGLSRPEDGIDIVAGQCDPWPVEFLIVTDTVDGERTELASLLLDAIATTLRTYGLQLTFRLVDATAVDNDLYCQPDTETGAVPLYEFDVSRHGAFTERPVQGLFAALPRLLTTVDLGPAVHPTTLSPLEQARHEGEKKLLQSLLASGVPHREMAQQLRLPSVELDELLRRHGLAPSPRAFAVSLPDDLLARAERIEF
ncbi:MAG: hypothetical protein QOD83_2147 [Solirubrobacteraceae bacterium]|nr:hypothetical protein [Solirubrobacteraceae bacterium]